MLVDNVVKLARTYTTVEKLRGSVKICLGFLEICCCDWCRRWPQQYIYSNNFFISLTAFRISTVYWQWIGLITGYIVQPYFKLDYQILFDIRVSRNFSFESPSLYNHHSNSIINRLTAKFKHSNSNLLKSSPNHTKNNTYAKTKQKRSLFWRVADNYSLRVFVVQDRSTKQNILSIIIYF